jgi:hypothetical protein
MPSPNYATISTPSSPLPPSLHFLYSILLLFVNSAVSPTLHADPSIPDIKLEFFAKIDVVATDIEPASFSYGVGRILRRSGRGLVSGRTCRELTTSLYQLGSIIP